MRYSGIQPQYFPRLHYFARMINADIFTLRDECQFVRNHKYPDGHRGSSYQSYSEVKGPEGKYGLTVSLTSPTMAPIQQVEVSWHHNWAERHLNIIKFYYKNTPNFNLLFPQLQEILNHHHHKLADLNIQTINWALATLLQLPDTHPSLTSLNRSLAQTKKIRLKKIVRSSNLTVSKNFTGLSADQKIISIIKHLGANQDYCGGTAVDAYMAQDLYAQNGISIKVQNWRPTPYPQNFDKKVGFIPNLSIIDLLMNVSAPKALQILKSNHH